MFFGIDERKIMNREFRLSAAGTTRGLSCDENGACLGTISLLKRSRPNGRWEPIDCGQLSQRIGAELGLPIDMSRKKWVD